jgi:predicted  nucleic acid-binding Zn-ribbon protein
MSKERDAYIEKARAQLDQLSSRIDLLQARASEAKADARIEYERELDRLRERRDAARSKLEDVRGASGAAWEDVREGFEQAWEALGEAVTQANERFR